VRVTTPHAPAGRLSCWPLTTGSSASTWPAVQARPPPARGARWPRHRRRLSPMPGHALRRSPCVHRPLRCRCPTNNQFLTHGPAHGNSAVPASTNAPLTFSNARELLSSGTLPAVPPRTVIIISNPGVFPGFNLTYLPPFSAPAGGVGQSPATVTAATWRHVPYSNRRIYHYRHHDHSVQQARISGSRVQQLSSICTIIFLTAESANRYPNAFQWDGEITGSWKSPFLSWVHHADFVPPSCIGGNDSFYGPL